MNIDSFLIGVIATASAIAGAFFLRFWQRSHDWLFLAFGCAFLIEAANRTRFVFEVDPGESAAGIYGVRLLAYSLILAAIVGKNFVRR